MFNFETSCSLEVVGGNGDNDSGFHFSHLDLQSEVLLSDNFSIFDLRSDPSEILQLILNSSSALFKNISNADVLKKIDTSEKFTKFVDNFYVKFSSFSNKIELKPRLKGGWGSSDEDSDDDFGQVFNNFSRAIKKLDSSDRKKITKQVNEAVEQINDPYISSAEASSLFSNLLSGMKRLTSKIWGGIKSAAGWVRDKCVIF